MLLLNTGGVRMKMREVAITVVERRSPQSGSRHAVARRLSNLSSYPRFRLRGIWLTRIVVREVGMKKLASAALVVAAMVVVSMAAMIASGQRLRMQKDGVVSFGEKTVTFHVAALVEKGSAGLHIQKDAYVRVERRRDAASHIDVQMNVAPPETM